ncbi:DUF1611 domain-containing protein [Streptococcus ruminicola]|uniref:S8 family serine peptidase n=1 Tax=Streptococcus ruminicola TaxID=2686210 RepID=UPI0039822889
MKVAIIDTGVAEEHSQIDYNRVTQISVRDDFSGSDTVGHGTALISLYQKIFPDVYIYSFKVFNGYKTSVDMLIEALEYIYHNLDVDLINFSLGVHTHHKDLEEICKKLSERGIILIAALDNNGYLSFPASYDCVIGVSNSELVMNVNDFIYVEGSPINILGYSRSQIVDWVDGKKEVIGNSFLLPYIAQSIFSESGKTCDLHSKLKEKAQKIIYCNLNEGIVEYKRKRKAYLKRIKKAVLFPINKEIINILDNTKNISFIISGVYDYRFSRKIKKSLTKFSYKKTENLEINSITNLDWRSDFDTFIIGHVKDLVGNLGKNILNEIIEKCLHYKKNLVVFDQISVDNYDEKFKNIGCFIYSPNLSSEVSSNVFGELWYNAVPTICIGGTSSKQGKFNLQMELRNEMINMGYKVGQIGTEPNAELLGLDYAYPNGYGTSKIFSDSEDIMYINQLVHSLQDRDLIIIGTQSGLVPYSQEHVNLIPLLPRNIIIGAQTDAVILCINPSDDLEYIERTITYVESFHDSVVLGLVMFPIKKSIDSITGEYFEKELSHEELLKLTRQIQEKITKPVYINGLNTLELAQQCINYFSGE